MATQELKNNEYHTNADAYSNHSTGFRIKCTMTFPSQSFYSESFSLLSFCGFSLLSFYGEQSETGESTKHCCQMDTPIKSGYDKVGMAYDRGEKMSPSDTLSLSPSGPIGGSIMAEYGRSMVEMLGTLAIIGVLSIGGIAGYSYAINKYRANATINNVNLRAVDLLSQLSQGHIPNLDSWKDDKTIYPISLNSDDAPDQYYITVKNVPHEICQLIAEMMPADVDILVDNDTQECKEGYNTLDFAYNGFEKLAEMISCPIGTSIDGQGGYANMSDADGNRCYCANANTKWDRTTSSCMEQDGTCYSFADCDRGEYCQFLPVDCTIAPTSGVCNSLSSCGEKGVYEQFWMSEYSGDCKPDWWTAQDICLAKGMTMVSLADIGCESFKNMSCSSDTLLKLRNIGLTAGLWTIDKNSDCYAFGISNYISNLVAGGRRENLYNVLCHK